MESEKYMKHICPISSRLSIAKLRIWNHSMLFRDHVLATYGQNIHNANNLAKSFNIRIEWDFEFIGELRHGIYAKWQRTCVYVRQYVYVDLRSFYLFIMYLLGLRMIFRLSVEHLGFSQTGLHLRSPKNPKVVWYAQKSRTGLVGNFLAFDTTPWNATECSIWGVYLRIWMRSISPVARWMLVGANFVFLRTNSFDYRIYLHLLDEKFKTYLITIFIDQTDNLYRGRLRLAKRSEPEHMLTLWHCSILAVVALLLL